MVAANSARRRHTRRGRPANEPGGGEVVARVRDGVTGATRYVAEQGRTVARQVKEATLEASQAVLQTVREEAERVYEKQKDRIAGRITRVSKIGGQAAHALRAVKADKAAEYVDDVSRRVGRATDYLEDHTLTEMMEDAGEIVRRNPALAVGGLFVAGFAVTRFLKATASRDAEGHRAAGMLEEQDRGAAESYGDQMEESEEDDSEDDAQDESVDEMDEDAGDEYEEQEEEHSGDEDEGDEEDRDEEEDDVVASRAADAQDQEDDDEEEADDPDEGASARQDDDVEEDAPAARRGNASRNRPHASRRHGR